MTRRTPRSVGEAVHALPPGRDERIAGSGVMGLSFESGDYLALRCMNASFGDPYTALWHRSAEGDWTVYSTADPEHSCERYIAAACTHPSVRTDIAVQWLDEQTVRVTAAEYLDWTIAVTSTPVTRMMSTMGRLMPHWMWVNHAVLAWMGRMAGPMLGVGKVRLSGRMPNGQKFTAAPVEIWSVADSRATLQGRDLGTPRSLAKQARIGGFWLPQKGIFMRGFGHFENFDAERHVSATAFNDDLLAKAS